MGRISQTVDLVQGSYYVSTGLWPLLHLKSFLAATGPKKEVWLVKTFGLLITVVGCSLVAGGARRRQQPVMEQVVLGLGSALVLASVDAWYVFRRRIAPTYLVDSVVELALAYAWQNGLRARRSGHQRHR
jgi:hypothetical protein